jgi:hypothetical protein
VGDAEHFVGPTLAPANREESTVNDLTLSDANTETESNKTFSNEEHRISRYRKRWKDRPPKIRTATLAEEGDDPLELLARYAEAVGSVSQDLRTLILKQISGVIAPNGLDEEVFMNAGLAVLHGLHPDDELEGMLGAQLFGLHVLGMEMMRRALLSNSAYGPGIPKLADANVNRADKLLRAFRETLTALMKYRGKSAQQRVTVEHVHVNEGGQAVVGAVGQAGGR